MKALFSSNCRVCVIARIHIALVFGILAAWRLQPEWFEFARDIAIQHLVAIAAVLVFFAILSVKAFEHYRHHRAKSPDRGGLRDSEK